MLGSSQGINAWISKGRLLMQAEPDGVERFDHGLSYGKESWLMWRTCVCCDLSILIGRDRVKRREE